MDADKQHEVTIPARDVAAYLRLRAEGYTRVWSGEGRICMAKPKSPGQIAYETELRAKPRYDDGALRPSWDKLPAIAQDSWERKPVPRWTIQEER